MFWDLKCLGPQNNVVIQFKVHNGRLLQTPKICGCLSNRLNEELVIQNVIATKKMLVFS